MLGLTLISTSNNLWLEFYSDPESTGEGFKLVYSSKLPTSQCAVVLITCVIMYKNKERKSHTLMGKTNQRFYPEEGTALPKHWLVLPIKLFGT